MPEGPSLVILRDDAARFAGRTVQRAEGAAAIDHARLLGRRVAAVRTFGKHFLMQFDGDVTLRVHFLLFGSWCVDDRKPDKVAKLSLYFDGRHEFHVYS